MTGNHHKRGICQNCGEDIFLEDNPGRGIEPYWVHDRHCMTTCLAETLAEPEPENLLDLARTL